MRKIDCHTHIINKNIRDAYFSRTDDIAIVMQFPRQIFSDPAAVRTVRSDPRLFLCPCIDLKRSIAPQLRRIEAHLDDWKVVGLKIYTSYQRGSADEARMIPVYQFAERLRLTVVFHTGLCSLVLPSDQDLAGSSAVHIAKAAEAFPGVNFVAAHMDDPNEQACCQLCAEHPNLFTDVSGLFEDGYEADQDVLKARYGGAVRAAGCESRLLYGTDFCPPIGLTDIERFDAFFAEIFSEKEREAICYGNALRAFPRLAACLKEQ